MSEIDPMRETLIRVEERVDTLTKEVHGLRNDVQKSQAPSLVTMQTELKHFKDKLDEIASDVKANSTRKTDWKGLITIGVAICGLLSSAGYAVYNAQNAKIDAKVNVEVFEQWRLAEERRDIERDRIIQELRNTRR